jgi:hypothetical protein
MVRSWEPPNVLDLLLPEPGAYYVMDRGYLDFERLYHLHEAGSFFVTRAKSNLKAERRYSHPVDRATGLICDQTVILSGYYSHKGFPVPLRRIKYIDPTTHKRLVFLTNQFALPALSIADLYRCRWQVELFFEYSTLCTPSDVIEFQRSADLSQRFVGFPGGFGSPPTAPHPLCVKSRARSHTPALRVAA